MNYGYRVWIDATHVFPRDESKIYIGERTARGFRVLKPVAMEWTEYDGSDIATNSGDLTESSLTISNELGKTLMEALINRYSAPKPAFDWEKHCKEVAAQRDSWRALYEAERERNGK